MFPTADWHLYPVIHQHLKHTMFTVVQTCPPSSFPLICSSQQPQLCLISLSPFHSWDIEWKSLSLASLNERWGPVTTREVATAIPSAASRFSCAFPLRTDTTGGRCSTSESPGAWACWHWDPVTSFPREVALLKAWASECHPTGRHKSSDHVVLPSLFCSVWNSTWFSVFLLPQIVRQKVLPFTGLFTPKILSRTAQGWGWGGRRLRRED